MCSPISLSKHSQPFHRPGYRDKTTQCPQTTPNLHQSRYKKCQEFPNGSQIHPHILFCCVPTAHTNPSSSLFLPEAYYEIISSVRAQRHSGGSQGRAHGVSAPALGSATGDRAGSSTASLRLSPGEPCCAGSCSGAHSWLLDSSLHSTDAKDSQAGLCPGTTGSPSAGSLAQNQTTTAGMIKAVEGQSRVIIDAVPTV